MATEVTKLAISFEDQPAVAHRLLAPLAPEIRKLICHYKTKTGRSRTPEQVAESAFATVAVNEALTAFLVDLVKDPQSHDLDYGLKVILELTQVARQDDNVGGLLTDQNFLTVVVTNFEPRRDDLVRVWGESAPRVEICVVRSESDVDRFIDRKATTPILPVVHKINHERLISPFLNKWFSSRVRS